MTETKVKIDIPTGTEDITVNFLNNYKKLFLRSHGMKTYIFGFSVSPERMPDLVTVSTEYGDLVVSMHTTIKYLGNCKWEKIDENNRETKTVPELKSEDFSKDRWC